MHSLFRVFAAAVLAAAATAPVLAAEAAWPTRDIHYIVPYPPGGTNDKVARIISKRLAEKTGQNVVVEYKPGAGGTIGAQYVANAEPDGYTLLNASIGNLAIAPQLVKTAFDPFRDFIPVTNIGNSRAVLAVNPKVPARTLQELIDYARANPGELTYATSGNGTPGHIAGELFKQKTGVDIRHVPYRGSAPALADVVGGHVDLIFDPLANQQVKEGALRGLAFFGAQSAPDLKDVPAIQAAGIPSWEHALAGSFFVSAPRNVPEPVIARLRALLDEILDEPQILQALSQAEVEVERLSAQALADKLHAVHDLSASILAAPQAFAAAAN